MCKILFQSILEANFSWLHYVIDKCLDVLAATSPSYKVDATHPECPQ